MVKPNDECYTEKVKGEELAERVGTSIPGFINISFWTLPILEKMIEKIEGIEQALDEMFRREKVREEREGGIQ